jgi:WhiB family redox-sensing transcriptional regulator
VVTVADAMLGTAIARLLRQLDASEPWRLDALCIEHPEARYFPERGESTEPSKALCARCAVQSECLDYALRHGIKEGIWGGLSGRERRRIRSEARVAA